MLQAQSNQPTVVVASDQRLARAAPVEGLGFFNPETDTRAQLESFISL
jgi:hypothetical protein